MSPWYVGCSSDDFTCKFEDDDRGYVDCQSPSSTKQDFHLMGCSVSNHQIDRFDGIFFLCINIFVQDPLPKFTLRHLWLHKRRNIQWWYGRRIRQFDQWSEAQFWTRQRNSALPNGLHWVWSELVHSVCCLLHWVCRSGDGNTHTTTDRVDPVSVAFTHTSALSNTYKRPLFRWAIFGVVLSRWTR